MALSPRPAALRWLEPFAASLWIFFLIWTFLVAVVWTFGIGETKVLDWTEHLLPVAPREPGATPGGFPAAAISLLPWLDPVWIVLAAANTYAFIALREGLDVARRWAAATLAVAAVITWLSAKTGWPLGPIHYTATLGPRLGAVPLCVPLLWLAVILGARDLALRLGARLSQAAMAVATAVLVLLFDVALEPLAWKSRVFWLWYPPFPSPPPVRNYVTWLVAAAVLAFALREERVATLAPPAHRSPAAIYLLMLTVLALGGFARHRV
jgi:uncharacterized membrane protein